MGWGLVTLSLLWIQILKIIFEGRGAGEEGVASGGWWRGYDN